MKIFLLEDEKIISDLYKKSLERNGYEVKVASSVSEGKEILKTFKPNIAFLDHGIKDEGGLELVKPLKEMIPQAKVYMLSNYNHDEFIWKCKQAGVDGTLIKLRNTPRTLIEFIKKQK